MRSGSPPDAAGAPCHDYRRRQPTTPMPRRAPHMHLPKPLLGLAVAAAAALLAAPGAQAAGPRPFFQMPVPCGQTWEASTYDGHWPDQNSVDLGEWSASDTNIGQGEPVLASAAGTVLDVFTDMPAGDIRV